MDKQPPETELSFDQADRVWEIIAECLERFVEAWESSSIPPAVREYLPTADTHIRQLALAELIKIDLEYRWQGDQETLLLESYFQEFSDLCNSDALPIDLLYEEYHIRKRSGKDVDPSEYFERFPKQETQLRSLLGMESPIVTSALFASSRPDDLEPGDQLGDFDLLARLGKGAFAQVFLARQRSMQRLLAVKISPDQGTEPQTLARLDHPNIVRVYDQHIIEDRKLRLLYMKYVAGGTLHGAIAQTHRHARESLTGRMLLLAVDESLDDRGESPPLNSQMREQLVIASWEETICILGSQLADALHYAHEQGVLHRDIKPANILLTSEGAPQLVDFNISYNANDVSATPAAYFGGSLAYMSPEQLEACSPDYERRPDTLSGTSDTYSLGVVLWELWTGERPFQDRSLSTGWSETIENMLELRKRSELLSYDKMPENPRSKELLRILNNCLRPAPEERYQNAQELADAFKLCQNEAALELLRPGITSWKAKFKQYALGIFFTILLLPNIFAGWFNFVYNRDHITGLQEYMQQFGNVAMVVNAVAFPLGLIILTWLFWPILQAIRNSPPDDVHEAKRLRHRCIRMGYYISLVCIAEWIVAGLVYPVAMHFSGASLDAVSIFHFACSLALCGMIVATYPFLAMSTFSVSVLYPALLKTPGLCREDESVLKWLEKKVWFFQGLGILLPLFGIILLVFLWGKGSRQALVVFSLGSFVGCGFLLLFSRRLLRDLATFKELIRLSR